MKCRFCDEELKHLMVDLGMTPLANAYLDTDSIQQEESFYPLRIFVCHNCFLVQLAESVESPKQLFSEYLYFSSYSKTWLNHTEELAHNLIDKFSLDEKNQVIEIASNDGYLLKHFKNKNIPILGIEPAENIAKFAEKQGIKTLNKFFGLQTANELKQTGCEADLLIAINVLPHLPNIKDFVEGIKKILKPNGVCMIQFSTYMLPFLHDTEFDSIYHEHYYYFSLLSVQKILSTFKLEIFDVDELSIHGGSLRIYVKHQENLKIKINQKVNNLIKKEIENGLDLVSTYESFSKRVTSSKLKIWNFFITAKENNKKIIGYGAPAKGNTMLNFCGIGKDIIEYTVDISPHKQGLFLPGTQIPIKKPEIIKETKPDYVIILAWNFKEEISQQMNFIREWGGKFIVLHPKIEIF
ncbi:class I SAM-dependent methyltransferase [bacterium]|nr:class I SAM-dependent methyltransferase [bacterium]